LKTSKGLLCIRKHFDCRCSLPALLAEPFVYVTMLIFMCTMGNYQCIVLCLVVPTHYLFTTFVHMIGANKMMMMMMMMISTDWTVHSCRSLSLYSVCQKRDQYYTARLIVHIFKTTETISMVFGRLQQHLLGLRVFSSTM